MILSNNPKIILELSYHHPIIILSSSPCGYWNHPGKKKTWDPRGSTWINGGFNSTISALACDRCDGSLRSERALELFMAMEVAEVQQDVAQWEMYDLIGGLEHVLIFHILGLSSSQLTNIFERGLNHQPVWCVSMFMTVYVFLLWDMYGNHHRIHMFLIMRCTLCFFQIYRECCHPKWLSYFQRGWNHQPGDLWCVCLVSLGYVWWWL